MLEASVDDIEFSGRQLHASRAPTRARRIGDVAFHTFCGPRPARRRRAVAGRRRDVRPGELLVPARHAPVCGRGRHRDRRGEDPQLHLRRRRRQGHQPVDRRGPGARRARPGHRAGAVRGGGLRRLGHPGHRLVRRLPGPECGGPAVVHDRAGPRRRRSATRSVSRASARPARSPRPRPSSTPSSTRSGSSASTTSRCRARHTGSGQRCSSVVRRGNADRQPDGRRRRPPVPQRCDLRRGTVMIPASFDYTAPESLGRRDRRAGR